MGPRVSKSKGTKQYAGKIAVYLADFLSAASSITRCLGRSGAVRLCQGVDDSSVPSQAPAASHGIKVTPSLRLPSDLTRPTGSFVAGKSALIRPRQVMSFMRACLAVRPCPRRHERPCEPSAVTNAPQGHSC